MRALLVDSTCPRGRGHVTRGLHAAYHATAVALVPPPERREPRMSQSELPSALSMGMASPLPVALPLPAPEVGLAALPHATPLSDDPLGDPANPLPTLPSP